jgi:hypothetical protein
MFRMIFVPSRFTYWSPCQAIEAYKDVTDSDDALSCSVVVHLPPKNCVAINRVNAVSVAGHKRGNSEVADTADNRSSQEERTARKSINEGQDGTCGYKKDDAKCMVSISEHEAYKRC